MSHYTMLSIYVNCTPVLKIKNKLKIGKNSLFFVDVINKTIIPLAFVRYEVIIDNSALRTPLTTHHLKSNAHAWNNCFKIVIENIG